MILSRSLAIMIPGLLTFCGLSASAAATSLNFTVNTSEAVTVDTSGGTPRLPLNVGGATRYASYASGSGSTSLTFSYPTQAGDLDLDGIGIASPLDLNGGLIRDLSGNTLSSLTFTPPATGNVKVSHPSIALDFIAQDYLFNGSHYASFPSFISAAGGSYSRASIGTHFDNNGIMRTASSGTPRFDHDPVTHAEKGILIEESRNNWYLYSMDFANAYWGKSSATVSADSALAPDGTTSGDKFVETADTAVHEINRTTLSIPANTSYTVSVFAKAAERSILRMYAANPDGAHSAAANYNLATGSVGTTVPAGSGTIDATSIQNIGNGWYRCTLSFRLTGVVTTRILFVLRTDDTTGTSSYAGTGTSGLYLWGAQLEAGHFPTSYIPTTSASVTRQADYISIPTGSWYSATGSTLYGEYSSFAPSGYSTRLANLHDGAPNQSAFLIANSQAGFVIAQKMVGGGPANNVGPVYVPGTIYKAAAATDAAVSPLGVNGALYTTAVPGSLPGISQLNIGNVKNSAYLNGWIRSFRYYPSRVLQAQTQLLTQ